MSRTVAVRPVTRGPPIVIATTPVQSKAASPDENVMYGSGGGPYEPKQEPLSAITSPEQLYPLHTGGFNPSVQGTPGSTPQWNHITSPPEHGSTQEKARRKLILDGPPLDGTKAKKAKVTTPVSRAKPAAGNSPGEREMDPSMISLADSPSTSSRRPSMGAPSNRFNYDLNEELGPDPTEGSTDWLALFDVHPRSKQLQQPVPVKRRKTTQQLQHRGPSLHVPSFELRRVKTEEEEFEEDVAAVVAAAAAAEPPMAKVRQPRPTNNLQQPHQRAAMRKETATIRDGRGSPTTPGGRLENSLLVLTKKFMELKNRSEELNRNEAAATLGVQKRRLNDITNVLEGIELVVKTGKNSIRWCQSGDETAPSECAEKEIMEEELRGMEAEEKRLDDLIRDLSNAFALVKEDPTDKPYAYVNFSDVHKAADDVGSEKMTIAVKSASSDATIEVADPVETGRFEMSIRCAQGLHAMLIPSGKTETAGGGGAVGVGEEEGRRTARDLNAPGTFTADGDVAGQQENGDIVLPSTTTGMSTLRQPCDDLITPSKMVEDNSCLSEYLSPLKFLVGTPMGLLHSTHDSPYLSIDTPNNSSVLQPGSSHPSTSAAAAAAYYHPSFLDGSGPSISDMYSNDDWF